MEKRVYVLDRDGEQLGYVRLGEDDIGEPIGEVYNPQADRVGAIRHKPLSYKPQESQVFNQEGLQIGYLRLEQYEDDKLGAELYRLGVPGTKDQVLAKVLYDPDQGAEVHKGAEWGEKLGSLKPENVEPVELVLVGGGAAYLLLI